MIVFNKPPYTGNEDRYVLAAMRSDRISGDGDFSRKCQKWMEDQLGISKVVLTPSCTHALEMTALLLDIKHGDEVIMPSYTFVSTANAFVLRGAKIVFVDIRPDTNNLDESKIEQAITDRTKAIVVVHYAGVSCEMEKIAHVSKKYGVPIIEDAAQGIFSKYANQQLGSIGHMAAFSFHETKNITSGGEGGALLINDVSFIERAEILREKGTNRSQYFRGMVDKYSWVDVGSSYLPCELQAAYLWGQLERSNEIIEARLNIWQKYFDALQPLAKARRILLPHVPANCIHNGHMFYIKLSSLSERTAFINYLKVERIQAVFHYVPLHSSVAGLKFGVFYGEDTHTTDSSERIVRLPLWYGMTDEHVNAVISAVNGFFGN